MVLVMAIIGVALFVFGIAMVWLFAVRSPKAASLSEQEFDDAYGELVAKGELVDRGEDRDAAWRDFRAWQAANAKERASWDEGFEE